MMKICILCKHEQDVDQFISERYGRATKTCQACRDRGVIWDKNNKCIHERKKTQCRECASQPKVILAQQMSRHSKTTDKKFELYEPENHITKEEILELLEEYPCCIWCECDLQYIYHQKNLATLERLCNNIGHLSGNCVIACLFCNIARKSDGRGVPHICVKCDTGEARGWCKMDEGWFCRNCWGKIKTRCKICDKKITKNNIAKHKKRCH